MMVNDKKLNLIKELVKESAQSKLIMDAKFEEFLASITELTATICLSPVALVTFVNDENIWIQSEVGVPSIKLMHNNGRFCGIFPEESDYFEISDTDTDTIHQAHAFSIKGEKAKFYAGAKIKLPLENKMFGVLCVLDTAPRSLISLQREYLLGMAKIIEKSLLTKNFVNRLI